MTETIRSEFAWAAFCTFGTPYSFIHTNAVRTLQSEVRGVIGEAWAHEGEDKKQGWKRAYRAGWRVIRVKISAFGGSHD